MVFSSLTFLLIFLPLTLLLYWLLPGKLKHLSLTVMSLIFYAWGEPVYVLLMLYSILLNYGLGLLMGQEPGHKKQVLVFGVILNLAMLGLFKYAGFFVSNVKTLFGITLKLPEIALPVGISFYTFQALSYVIDLYRGKIKVQRNLISFACYITMFPQLIAGPIVRYESIEAELMDTKLSLPKFGEGSLRFLKGLFKKVLLANTMGALFEYLSPGTGSVLSAWLKVIAFTLQIYFDFSGYSDMAVGLGKMLGFTFPENFDHPYVSSSVTEFWRRWHMSLGTWFREYVYIPLGGNRVSVLKHIRNILVVWLLTGLWHGAGWSFILWGLYYGLLLLFEKYVVQRVNLPKVLGIFLTLLAVMAGWVLFFSDDLSSAAAVFKAMIGIGTKLTDRAGLYALTSYGIPMLVSAFFCLPFLSRWYERMMRLRWVQILTVPAAVLIFVWILAALITESYNPFLYFRF